MLKIGEVWRVFTTSSWGEVERRVNKAGMKLLCLEGSVCEGGGPQLTPGNLVLVPFSKKSEWFTLLKLHKQRDLCRKPAFWESRRLVLASQMVPLWPYPRKNLGCWVHNGIPRQKHCTWYCTCSCWRKEHAQLCPITGGSGYKEAWHWFLCLCLSLMIQLYILTMWL